MNYINIFETFTKLHIFLEKYGIKFTSDGYPVFRNDFILWETPHEILPFEHRSASNDKRKTVICFFANDRLLYRRLLHLITDIEIYKQYMGICGFDFSPRIGWNIESQKFNICLSQMATLYVALHGVKVLPNFRIGELDETISSLSVYPLGCPFTVGTLGCSQKKVSAYDEFYFQSKIMYALPSNLYFYGQLKSEYRNILDANNFSYRIFEDFRTHCFNERGEKAA